MPSKGEFEQGKKRKSNYSAAQRQLSLAAYFSARWIEIVSISSLTRRLSGYIQVVAN